MYSKESEITVHTPVLLREVVDNLPVPPCGRVLDLTLGLGGHAEAILSCADSGTRYLGVDCDSLARAKAEARLRLDSRISIIASKYEDIWTNELFQNWMQSQATEGFDVILMDLGVSSLQLKDPNRGFSFKLDGPLDMRMDPETGCTALEWLAQQTDDSLADTIYMYGEEKASRPIARVILKHLNQGLLHTTFDLARAIYTVLPKEIAYRKKQIDPATRTFQAIRIAVNGELTSLDRTISNAISILNPGGRIGVISFHSLEDRIVKRVLRRLSGIYDGAGRVPPKELSQYIRLIHSGGLKASETELTNNASARSARLRIGERIHCNDIFGLYHENHT